MKPYQLNVTDILMSASLLSKFLKLCTLCIAVWPRALHYNNGNWLRSCKNRCTMHVKHRPYSYHVYDVETSEVLSDVLASDLPSISSVLTCLSYSDVLRSSFQQTKYFEFRCDYKKREYRYSVWWSCCEHSFLFCAL